MSHGITSTDSMFTVRQPAWHGLGEVLPDHPTREQAQQIAHPWEPVSAPVYKRVPVVLEDGTLREEYVEIEGSKVIERSDNGHTLGIANETLGEVTNSQLWDVVEATGKVGTDIHIETAGSLSGGKKVWALLRLAEPLRIKGDPQGDTLAFLALQNGHAGTASFRAQALNTRIVCANTSAAADVEAKRNGYEFTFRHSSRIQDRIEDAKNVVSMWREGVTAWSTAMEHLATVRVTPAQKTWFVEQFQPMPPNHLTTDRVRSNVEKARGDLLTILNSQTSDGIDLTAYGLYMAGLEYHQHVRPVKGKTQRSRMESHFKRSMMSDSGFAKSTLSLAQDAALATV